MPGAAAARYAARVEQLEDMRDSRRERKQRTAAAPSRARERADQSPTVVIPRSTVKAAEKAWQARERDERKQRDQADRADRQARERASNEQLKRERQEQQMVNRQAKKLNKQRDRAVMAYMRWGLTPDEAQDMYEKTASGHYDEVQDNPRRRRRRNPPEDSAALAIAAGILAERNSLAAGGSRLQNPGQQPDLFARHGGRVELELRKSCGHRRTAAWPAGTPSWQIASDVRAAESRPCRACATKRRRNPALGAIVADVAKNVLQGGLVAAAAEEFKEWRDQAHKGGPSEVVRAHDSKARGKRRRNPARLEPDHADPKLREMSRRFHGVETEILHLDPDQRRPPPVHVVKIGEERATVYRPSNVSERSGADWEHDAGDVGAGRPKVRGNRIVVADEHGRVYLVNGSSSMYFDPDKGLVK